MTAITVDGPRLTTVTAAVEYYSDPLVRMLHGDVLDCLRGLPSRSVHVCVTSPPYWGLRDYGTGTWDGGDPECDHFEPQGGPSAKQESSKGTRGLQYKGRCLRCGAIRIDQQIGMEALHDCAGWATGDRCGVCYICRMTAVFAEVKRVLRDDGTFWLNIGDSYNGSGGAGGDYAAGGLKEGQPKFGGRRVSTLKPKDLCLIPSRLALSLQAEGWYVRSQIVWAKKAPMPESVADRPTSSWEPIWLLTKQKSYFFDSYALREGVSGVVEGSNFTNQGIVFGQNFGFQKTTPEGSVAPSGMTHYGDFFESCIELAAAFFEGTQLEDDFGLTPLDPQVRQQVLDQANSVLVRCAPIIKRATVRNTSLISAYLASIQLLEKLKSLGIALSDGDIFRVGRRVITIPNAPLVNSDSNASVRIDNASEVRQFNSVHNQEYTTNGTTSSKQAETTRNSRNVWLLSPDNFSEAHFATFPTEIPRRAIKAGTSERGCCPACGAPWVRVKEPTEEYAKHLGKGYHDHGNDAEAGQMQAKHEGFKSVNAEYITTGWQPTCTCNAGNPIPCTVLDCFLGSGTTAMVANTLGRFAIGIDLSREYLDIALRRVRPADGLQPVLFSE